MNWQQIKSIITWAVLISGVVIVFFYVSFFLLNFFDVSSESQIGKIFESFIATSFIFFLFAPLIVSLLSFILVFFEKNPRTKKTLILMFLAIAGLFFWLIFILSGVAPTPA